MNHYLYLLEDNFVCEELLEFLQCELGLTALVSKIRRWVDGRSDMLQIIFMIEQDIHYYTDGELIDLKQRIDQLRQATKAERAKLRADF